MEWLMVTSIDHAISHQPLAISHFEVSRVPRSGRTVATVRPLLQFPLYSANLGRACDLMC
jgi:hypothetical protein